ncbi:MAG TPA: DUF885 domain-containing protein [Usitatibacter sp.]|nr:DUF885 domain-containing protein [Usitatibacter sp.]
MRHALAAAALAATAAFGAEPPANKDLHALFEREFKVGLEEHPERATFLGIPGYDDRLTDFSNEAVARRRAHVKRVIGELKRFDPKSLSTQDRISRDVMLDALELVDQQNALYGDLPFSEDDDWLPVSSMQGPQNLFPYLARATSMKRGADYANYVKRLSAIPKQLDQTMARMRAGMKSGWMPPRAAMSAVPGMFDVFASENLESSPLFVPFTQFPQDMPAAERDRWTAEGKRALAGVREGFARMQRFLADEYIPGGRTQLGASTLPGGAAYYALQVREKTTTTLSPAEIHGIGLDEVARIRKSMDEVIKSTAFAGSFADFLKSINSDPRFTFKTPEARLAAYRDIAKRADAELPKFFAELPRLPYGIRAMEAFEGDNSDHYSPGALDGSRAGFFEANVNNLEKRPSFEMESTLMHEAVPGHHLQTARAQELKDLPLFRRSSWYVAYGEGWALYAESLGYEMGFYKDPYMRFGALVNEALRACRLVVDTGLHTMGWTREQAIRYMVDNAGVNEAYATSEVDRYIVLPAQALGYKIGELRIKALRAKAKAALGDKFDIRRFHNAILDDGPLPLTVLEARIDEWITKEKK